MNTQNILLYAEILAVCFILTVCITGKVYQSEKPDSGNLLLRFNICTIFAVLINFLWVNVNGNTIASAPMVKLVTVIYYFTLNTAFYFWMRFSENSLFPAAGQVKSYVFLSAIPYIITNILVAASCFFNWIFSVDNLNNLTPGPIWIVEYIFIFATLLWSAGTAFSFNSKATDPSAKQKAIHLASFVILPFVCVMLHVFTKNSPLCVIALSLLSIFSFREIQVAENKALAEEAARHEQEYLARIEAAENKAAIADQRRLSFLRRTVFDFSSPLMTVNSLLEKMSDPAADPETITGCINKIRSYNNFMSRLIADASEMSDLETGSLTLYETLNDLPDELAGLADMWQIQAAEKQTELAIDIPELNDRLVRHDAKRLSQILSNLMDNAFKNTTAEDTVSFSVQQVEPAVPDSASFIFSVSDNGHGYTEEEVAHLFEVSADPDNNNDFGLVIVKKLADLMNAKINVDSSPKEGTTISLFVSFPLPTEEELAALNESAVTETETDEPETDEQPTDEDEYPEEETADEAYSDEELADADPDLEPEPETDPDQPADETEPADTDTAVLENDGYVPTEEEADILNRASVLVVEDNDFMRKTAQELLESLGVTVTAAIDGADAIEKARNANNGQYDLILMNIRMPHINGYEAAQTIRSLNNKRIASLPIVAMDTDYTLNSRQEMQRLGMTDLIPKPLKKRALVRVITKYC